ncbi:MAG: SPASM domain-containing protein, partial [Bryobacteraceae bacterium]
SLAHCAIAARVGGFVEAEPFERCRKRVAAIGTARASHARRDALQTKLTAMFEAAGMEAIEPAAWHSAMGKARHYHFFGATPDSWIGKLWPRGRAQANELSQATVADNFCNGWSGGLNFLQPGFSGSEVSIEPNGNVYPCCAKTRLPVGNLQTQSLDSILRPLQGNPVYEAISMGHPERMGLRSGWSVEKFLAKSVVRLPSGRLYQNLCVGCDRFHEEVLAAPELVSLS